MPMQPNTSKSSAQFNLPSAQLRDPLMYQPYNQQRHSSHHDLSAASKLLHRPLPEQVEPRPPPFHREPFAAQYMNAPHQHVMRTVNPMYSQVSGVNAECGFGLQNSATSENLGYQSQMNNTLHSINAQQVNTTLTWDPQFQQQPLSKMLPSSLQNASYRNGPQANMVLTEMHTQPPATMFPSTLQHVVTPESRDEEAGMQAFLFHDEQGVGYSTSSLTPSQQQQQLCSSRPYSSAISNEGPTAFQDVRKTLKSLSPVNWINDPNRLPCERTLQYKTLELEQFIGHLCDGNEATAAAMFNKLARQHDGITSSEQECGNETANWVGGSIYKFIEHHKRQGRRTNETGAAMMAVASAVSFSDQVPRPSRSAITNLTGVPERDLKRAEEINRDMKALSKPFQAPIAKTRSDNWRPFLKVWIMNHVCHNPRFTRVDSAAKSHQIKCNVPVIKAMEGGGWEIIDYIEERHPKRMWEATTVTRIHEMVLESQEWKDLKSQYPDITLGRSVFADCLCTCCSEPVERSCVNEIKSQQRFYQRAIAKALEGDSELKRQIQACPCEIHARPVHRDALIWTDHLYDDPKDFALLTSCPKARVPEFKLKATDDDATAPLLTPWKCSNGECDHCGVKRTLKITDCPVLSTYDRHVRVMEWDEAKRPGKTKNGKSRTQKEPVSKDLPLCDVVTKLEEQTITTLEHVGETERFTASRYRQMETFPPTMIDIDSDFSAVPALRAIETACCSEDNHCVLDVFVVRHSPKEVSIVMEDGTITKKRVCETTYWAVIGPTDSYGKSNDHVYHHAALHHIVDWHKKDLAKKGIKLDQVRLTTDNCSGQYKSQYNFFETAAFADRHPGIRLTHGYAVKFEFKGNHDGHGKTCKNSFADAEKNGRRIEDALAGYEYMLEKRPGKPSEDWPLLEAQQDPKLLNHTPHTPTDVQYAYCTDKREEFDKLRQERPDTEHIIFCPRHSIPPCCGTIQGSDDFGETRGTKLAPVDKDEDRNKGWEFEYSAFPCYCIECGEGDYGQCSFTNIRKPKRRVLFDKSTSPEVVMFDFLKRKYKWKTYMNKDRLKELLRTEGAEFDNSMSRPELIAQLYAKVGPQGAEDVNTVTIEEVFDAEEANAETIEEDKEAILNPLMGVDDASVAPPEWDDDDSSVSSKWNDDDQSASSESDDNSTGGEGSIELDDEHSTASDDAASIDLNDLKEKEWRSNNELRQIDQMRSDGKEGLELLTVIELKDDLEKRRLGKSGKKGELIGRLRQFLNNA